MRDKLTQGLDNIHRRRQRKTTAARLAYRAVGHDFNVCFIQFMKGSSYCGELFTSQRLKPYLDFYQFGRGCPHSSVIRSGFRTCDACGECFLKDQKHQAEHKAYATMAYDFAKSVLQEEKYDRNPGLNWQCFRL